jgi:2-polyprenyl-6-methoxyphenol hydroxylase-like FAD-dependent oxidoreductase
VIILGAGPVGLGAALELARFGVQSVLIEKHETTSWHPKTRNLCTRTMEIARGWGRTVYKRLRSIDTPDGWKSPIRFLTSATGEQYGLIESKGFEGPGPTVSPALPIMSSQELIEEILLDAVRASGLVEIRFGVEALRLLRGGAPSDGEAVLEVKDRATGAVEAISGTALVAADGAASLIRGQLGLRLEGPQDMHHIINC